MTTGEKIKNLRTALNMSQEELGKKVGVQKAAINKYENDIVINLKRTVIVALARALDTTPAYLMGWDDMDQAVANALPWYTPGMGTIPEQMAKMGIEPLPQMRKVPIIGAIACGTPILAEENIEGYARMSEQIDADFCLRCVGDSMIGARIMDGDIVYIKTDAEIVDGRIYAVLVNGDVATLKRVYRIGDERLELRPENPNYTVQRYAGNELEGVRIIGRAVAFTSAVR